MPLGRLEINTSVIALAYFRTKLRKKHLERAKRIVSYLIKFKYTTIRFKTDKTNLFSIPVETYK